MKSALIFPIDSLKLEVPWVPETAHEKPLAPTVSRKENGTISDSVHIAIVVVKETELFVFSDFALFLLSFPSCPPFAALRIP